MSDLQFAILVTVLECLYFGTPIPVSGNRFFDTRLQESMVWWNIVAFVCLLYVWIDWLLGVIA